MIRNGERKRDFWAKLCLQFDTDICNDTVFIHWIGLSSD